MSESKLQRLTNYRGHETKLLLLPPTEARKKDKGGGGYLLMSALMMGKHDVAHNERMFH